MHPKRVGFFRYLFSNSSTRLHYSKRFRSTTDWGTPTAVYSQFCFRVRFSAAARGRKSRLGVLRGWGRSRRAHGRRHDIYYSFCIKLLLTSCRPFQAIFPRTSRTRHGPSAGHQLVAKSRVRFESHRTYEALQGPEHFYAKYKRH